MSYMSFVTCCNPALTRFKTRRRRRQGPSCGARAGCEHYSWKRAQYILSTTLDRLTHNTCD